MQQIDLFVWRGGRREARHRLDPGTYRIGRAVDNDVILSSPVVSRDHARILVDGTGIVVVDEHSQNGMTARGRRVEQRQVGAGDVVCIDPFVLEFKLGYDNGHRVDEGETLIADSARLVALEGRFYRTHIALPTSRVTIGRSPTSDIVIPDSRVSLNHAEIRNIGGTYLVIDLGSPVGTEVNDTRIHEACLTHGDRIRVGSTVYWFDVMSRRQSEGVWSTASTDDDTVPLAIG